jgi:hypothetical protein
MNGDDRGTGNETALRIAHDAGNGGGSDTLSRGVGDRPHKQAAHDESECCQDHFHRFLL